MMIWSMTMRATPTSKQSLAVPRLSALLGDTVTLTEVRVFVFCPNFVSSLNK